MANPKKRDTLFVDQDYWKKLSPDELKWLREFNNKFYKGSADHDGDLLSKRSEAQLREDYKRNNDANNDLSNLNFLPYFEEPPLPFIDDED